MKKSLVALAASALLLAGCTETLGGLAIAGAAVAGVMTSGSANPDYAKYAETCRAIVGDILLLRAARYEAISTGLNSANATVAGGAMVMLAMESRDDGALFSRCQLQGPESFLQTIFKNTNVANLVLALYQENRADSRAQRMMELQRQLGLAQMEHAEIMQGMENDLLTDLAGRPTDNFNAGAAAARPVLPPQPDMRHTAP